MTAALLALPNITAPNERDFIEQPYDMPDTPSPFEDPDEPSDLDYVESKTLPDDEVWDVFLPDDDEYDLDPDPSEYWGNSGDDGWGEEPE